MQNKLNNSNGFTLIELLVVVAIVAILGSLISIAFSATINGSFTTAPATVPAGSSTTFTYTVTQTWAGNTRPKSGRNISFRVAPIGTINITPTTGTTNGLGVINVTVTPHVDYRGGANIWAKDVKSGIEDNPVYFSVN